MNSRAESHARTLREIAQEKAVTLGRAGERLEAALAQVAAAAAAWRAAGDAERARRAEDYERAWQAAEAARTTLLIQREAVGLRHHRDVDAKFPRPSRRPA